MTTTSTLPDWFATALQALRAGDLDGYMAMYAPDAVHEFPFAPPGFPPRLVGRDAIAAYMREIPKRVRFGSVSDLSVREAGDELIVEATAHNFRVSDGAPTTLTYVWIVTRRDGLVTNFRDYMNPLQLKM